MWWGSDKFPMTTGCRGVTEITSVPPLQQMNVEWTEMNVREQEKVHKSM